jgi:hypothetical protein
MIILILTEQIKQFKNQKNINYEKFKNYYIIYINASSFCL